jgi:hypothetical protein
MKATWGDTRRVVESVEDLAAVVDAIRKSAQPTMVFLEASSGAWLAFGVGHEESVLVFGEADPHETFHSLGEPYRKGVLEFLSQGQLDEFSKEGAIPGALALRAAEQFLATGVRPDVITWESD